MAKNLRFLFLKEAKQLILECLEYYYIHNWGKRKVVVLMDFALLYCCSKVACSRQRFFPRCETIITKTFPFLYLFVYCSYISVNKYSKVILVTLPREGTSCLMPAGRIFPGCQIASNLCCYLISF